MSGSIRVVPRERVHVIVFDDLVRDSRSTWEALAAYLRIDAGAVPSLAAANASDKAARWPLLRRLTHRPPPGLEAGVRRLRQWSRTTTMPGVATLKRGMWRPEPRPVVSGPERQEIAEHFKADVELLAELLERDLSAWADA
jgi:hypothetical protein